MSLEQWAKNSWLRPHKSSKQEVANLLEIVDRDLKDIRPIVDTAGALYRTMCAGSCKHLGPIPPSNILSFRTGDGKILFGKDTE
jgi:hypothetical protein